jgi:hypothetical protein
VPHAARTRRTRALVAGSARNSNDARTASVQVALGSATAQAVLQLTQPESRLVEASMAFPLGLVLESECGVRWRQHSVRCEAAGQLLPAAFNLQPAGQRAQSSLSHDAHALRF